MNNDRQFEQYFKARNGQIDLGETPIGAVMERGRARQRRRHVAKVGVATGVIALVGVTVAQAIGNEPTAEINAAAPTAVKLQWHATKIDPSQGLSQTKGDVVSVDGKLYGISTSPLAVGSPGAASDTATLYASNDNETWQPLAAPQQFRPSGLGTDGDHLYAVGTSPLGGNSESLHVGALEADGRWSLEDLPLDVPKFSDEAGMPVRIDQTRVVAKGDTRIVTAHLQGTKLDLADVAPSLAARGEHQNWSYTADGVVIEGPCSVDAPSSSSTQPSADAENPGGDEALCQRGQQPGSFYSWEDLNVSPTRVKAVLGTSLMFRSVGDGPFVPLGEMAGSIPTIVADDNGFWLAQESFSGTRIEAVTLEHSPDGQNWTKVETPDSSLAKGWLRGSGHFGERAAFAFGNQGALSVWLAGPDGGEFFDLAQQMPGREVSAVAFGPLGFAAITVPQGASDVRPFEVVFSSDLRELVSQVIEPANEADVSPVNLTVTADAVIVRISDRTERKSVEEPGRPMAYVGVPQ